MADLLQLLDGEAWQVAPRLLGCRLVRQVDGQRLVAKIVEVEAYDQTDAASHSYRGRTKRSEVMFGPSGHLYVYFTYGMHYCCNVVVGPAGHGAGLLIRAAQPLEGIEAMRLRRGGRPDRQLTNGPGKLCQALGVDLRLSGHDLTAPPLQLIIEPSLPTSAIAQTTRVGISRAVDQPWRFFVRGNAWVSKPWPK